MGVLRLEEELHNLEVGGGIQGHSGNFKSSSCRLYLLGCHYRLGYTASQTQGLFLSNFTLLTRKKNDWLDWLMPEPISFEWYDSVTLVTGQMGASRKRESHQLLPLEGAIPVNHIQDQENNCGIPPPPRHF